MPIIELDGQRIEFPTREAADEFIRVESAKREQNPLLGWLPHPCRNCGRRAWRGEGSCDDHAEPQYDFMVADTRIVAAFAGNRFGKTTALTVSALREALDRVWLPPLLADHKRFDEPTAGWILLPSEDKIEDSFRPAFQKWTPPAALVGGSWGKAYNGASRTLRFQNGSTIAFKTYKQDHSTLGGAGLHWVGYDEPPPRLHREEARTRTWDTGGPEWFAMTPLQVNTGYIRREIWKNREAPNITVVKGSVHDNRTLDQEAVEESLGSLTDIWRKAREFGDFVDVGGLIYPDFERCVVKEPFDLDFIRQLDIVVGIDPGIRNAGFAWVGFDKNWTAYVFNEGLLQDKEAGEYARFVRSENSRLQLDPKRITYVIDPAARSRGQVNATTVMSALAQEGIYANPGQNDHETGFDQLRTRMARGRFHVSPLCVGMRDEADDYAAKEPGEFDDDSHLNPVSNQFHRLDACFVAGTLVATEHGERPIEEIRPGDRVWTRKGLRPVLAAAMTNADAEVYDLGPLTGTGNHPVWTDNRGWVELDSVRYGDIIRTWPRSQSSSTVSSIAGIPTRIDELIVSTIGASETGTDLRPISTGTSTSTTSARSRTDGTSTTRTKTRSTTIRQIWSAFLLRNIRRNIGQRRWPPSGVSGSTRFDRSPRPGTPPRLAASGIVSTLIGPCWPWKMPSTAANIAMSRSWHDPRSRTASAPTGASRLGGALRVWTMLTGRASSAATRSGSTSTPRRSAALGSVARLRAQTEAVYNLTVDGCPEYFANGVLVHNCRYAVMERFWDPRTEEQAKDRNLGYKPGVAPPMQQFLKPRKTSAPHGAMS